jgi:hypothetical protein
MNVDVVVSGIEVIYGDRDQEILVPVRKVPLGFRVGEVKFLAESPVTIAIGSL